MSATEKSLLSVRFCGPPLLAVGDLRLEPANRQSHRLLVWLTVRPLKGGAGFELADRPSGRDETMRALGIAEGTLRSARSDLRKQLDGVREGLGDELIKARLDRGEGDALQLRGRRLRVDVVELTERLARARQELEGKRWLEAAEVAEQIADQLAGAFEDQHVKPWLQPFEQPLRAFRDEVASVERRALSAFVQAAATTRDPELRDELARAGQRLAELREPARAALGLLLGAHNLAELRGAWRDTERLEDLSAGAKHHLQGEYERLEAEHAGPLVGDGNGAGAQRSEPLPAAARDGRSAGSAARPTDGAGKPRTGLRAQLPAICAIALALAASGVLALVVEGEPARAPAATTPTDGTRARGPTSPVGWWPPRGGVRCPTTGCSSTTANQLNARVFTVERGVGYPTGIPDERAFVTGFPATRPEHYPRRDTLDVEPGDEIRVVAVVSNVSFDSSTAGIRADEYESRSTANDVRAGFLVPSGCGRERHVLGVVSHRSDSNDELLSDSLTLRSSQPICVRAIPGTAELRNQFGVFDLSDEIELSYDPDHLDRRTLDAGDGVSLGCEELDGRLQGGTCDGYVRLGLQVSATTDEPLMPSDFNAPERLLDEAGSGADRGLSVSLDVARDRRTARFDVTYYATRTEVASVVHLVVPPSAAHPTRIGAHLASGYRPRLLAVAELTEPTAVLPVFDRLVEAPPGSRWRDGTLTLPSLFRGRSAKASWRFRLEPLSLDVDLRMRAQGGDTWSETVPVQAEDAVVEGRATISNPNERGLRDTRFEVTLPQSLEFAEPPVLTDELGRETRLSVIEIGPGRNLVARTGAEHFLRTDGPVEVRFELRPRFDPARIRLREVEVSASASSGGVHGSDTVTLPVGGPGEETP